MAKFRRKPVPVDAVQLRWDTWSQVCELVHYVDAPDDRYVGCYVGKDGKETADTNGRIGLKFNSALFAVQDDWIVQLPDGELASFKPAPFEALFEGHADYKVDYEPDWSKYPKLSAVFEHRPTVNVYWDDLRALLTDARADAVQYVHDVRADELARARADERSKIRDRLAVVGGGGSEKDRRRQPGQRPRRQPPDDRRGPRGARPTTHDPWVPVVTYDEIHPAMREALGAFEVLRRFGFKSEDIFFHQNADEPPGPEPFGMMFVVLKTRGKSFSIRVGVVDLPYAAWADGWKAVATAALEERIEQIDRIVEESEAFREKVRLMMAIDAKGIAVPVTQRHLS